MMTVARRKIEGGTSNSPVRRLFRFLSGEGSSKFESPPVL